MKQISLVFIMLILGGTYIFAQHNATAFSILSKQQPTIKWNAKSLVKGDFDFDGVADFALRGRKEKIFILGIVKGALNNKSKIQMLKFSADSGDQGSLCSVDKAIIETDDLDKDYIEFAKDYLEPKYIKAFARLPKDSKGITISDKMCDSFHVFWDKQTNKFIWWRV
jgi:hypothetical protein